MARRASIPNRIVKEIVKRDGSANCFYCGKTGYSQMFTGTKGKGTWLSIEHEIDHIKPHSLGGSDEIDNLVIACRDCNSKKRDKVGWIYGKKANDRPELLAK